ALEGLGKHNEADALFRTALARLGRESREVRAGVRLLYGFAVARRLPDRAREAFTAVLAEQADHPQAHYGQAMLLAEEGKLCEALACFDRALDGNSHFVGARRFRAVLRARCGWLEEATLDINRCLDKEKAGGATFYPAACVAALVAGHKGHDPFAARTAVDQAFEMLQHAFALGYGRDKAAADDDLKPLRDDPRFPRLLAKRNRR